MTEERATVVDKVQRWMDAAGAKAESLRNQAEMAATISTEIEAKKGKIAVLGMVPAPVVDALFALVELIGLLTVAQCEAAAALAESNAREFRSEIELKQAQDFVAGIQAELRRNHVILPGMKG